MLIKFWRHITAVSLAILVSFVALNLSFAQEQEVPEPVPAAVERLDRLWVLTQKVDENAQRNAQGNVFIFKVSEREVTLVSDVRADRMRLLTPIAPEGILSPELMMRLLKANFDTALDARYGVARGAVWGVFIHPLSALSDQEYLSAVGQTVNVANSFGTTFSSGAMAFGGGDSMAEMRKLLEDLQGQAEEPL